MHFLRILVLISSREKTMAAKKKKNGDKHLISPCKNTLQSNMQVLTIKAMIQPVPTEKRDKNTHADLGA